MPELLDLPVELIDAIIAYVYLDNDIPTLMALCKTSRALRVIAQPRFYRFIGIGNPQLKHSDGDCCMEDLHDEELNDVRIEAKHVRPLALFVRTLILRPDLASQMQVFGCQLPNDTCGFTERDIESDSFLADEDIQLFVKSRPATVDWAAAWKEDIVTLRVGAFTTLLVSTCPGLKVLHIRVGTAPVDFTRLLDSSPQGRPFTAPFVLEHLRELHLRGNFSSEPFELAPFMSVLSWPSLRTFRAVHCIANLAESSFVPLAGSSKLADLELCRCCMDSVSLVLILNACNGLQSFTYNALSRHAPGQEHQFAPSQLLPALERHKKTLEFLSIYVGNAWMDFLKYLDPYDNPLRLPSFRHFESLTDLRIEYDRLKTTSRLPPALEYLNIYRWGDAGLDVVEELIEIKQKGCPAMREIYFDDVPNEWHLDQFLDLVEALNCKVYDEDGDLSVLFLNSHLVINTNWKSDETDRVKKLIAAGKTNPTT